MKPHGMMVAALACLWTSMACASGPGAGTWEFYPGLKDPAKAGMHLGDFDGDGQDEVLLASSGYDGNPHFSQRYSVLSSPAPDEFGIQSIAAYAGSVEGTAVWRVPGGASHVAALTQYEFQRSIVILSGIPLRVERVIPAPLVNQLCAVADLDGDGSLEIVVLSGTNWTSATATAISLDSGQVKWTSTYTASSVTVGQLDSDSALELVLSGTPGRILDGAQGALEWSFPSGFGDGAVVGRFGTDAAVNAIAIRHFEHVTLFSGFPYSPIRDVSTGRGAMTSMPRGSDGGELLVRGSVGYDLRTADSTLKCTT